MEDEKVPTVGSLVIPYMSRPKINCPLDEAVKNILIALCDPDIPLLPKLTTYLASDIHSQKEKI